MNIFAVFASAVHMNGQVNTHTYATIKKQVDILISTNQALQILYHYL